MGLFAWFRTITSKGVATKATAPITRPPFKGTLGDLQHAPPFHFKTVKLREYEVKANGTVLRGLCDDYLNLGPERGWIPYRNRVFVLVANYGEMRNPSGGAGYTTQDELAFSMLVYKPPNNYAWFSPYLVVNDPLSLCGGREVGGFPKTWGEFEWNPENPWVAATVSTGVFDGTTPYTRFQSKPIVEILPLGVHNANEDPDDEKAPSNWPFGVGMYDHENEDSDQTPDLSQQSSVAPLLPPELLKTVGLIQFREFRDYEHPHLASYHGLNYGVYRFKCLNGGGVLSRNPKIIVNKYNSLDIAQALGLEWSGNDKKKRPLTVVRSIWANWDFNVENPHVLHSEH